MPSSKRHHVALIYREWVRFVRDGHLMIHSSRVVRTKARKGMLEKLLEKAPAVDLLDNAAVIVCELLATQKVGVRVELMLSDVESWIPLAKRLVRQLEPEAERLRCVLSEPIWDAEFEEIIAFTTNRNQSFAMECWKSLFHKLCQPSIHEIPDLLELTFKSEMMRPGHVVSGIYYAFKQIHPHGLLSVQNELDQLMDTFDENGWASFVQLENVNVVSLVEQHRNNDLVSVLPYALAYAYTTVEPGRIDFIGLYKDIQWLASKTSNDEAAATVIAIGKYHRADYMIGIYRSTFDSNALVQDDEIAALARDVIRLPQDNPRKPTVNEVADTTKQHQRPNQTICLPALTTGRSGVQGDLGF